MNINRPPPLPRPKDEQENSVRLKIQPIESECHNYVLYYRRNDRPNDDVAPQIPSHWRTNNDQTANIKYIKRFWMPFRIFVNSKKSVMVISWHCHSMYSIYEYQQQQQIFSSCAFKYRRCTMETLLYGHTQNRFAFVCTLSGLWWYTDLIENIKNKK